MPNVGVLLSGCGVKDGSEIHEAVLTLLFLDQRGATAVCMAPNMDQHQVVNHLSGQTVDEKRNVLVESARIARGDIRDVRTVQAADLDALILPGGFGAVINLSDFAVTDGQTTVQEDVDRLLKELAASGKPIGAACIAPATVARSLSHKEPALTIGSDAGTAARIETMGARHQSCPVDDIFVDTPNNLVTTPAYMLGPGIKDIARGLEKLVDAVLDRV